MKIPKHSSDPSKYPTLPAMQPLVVEIVRPSANDKPNPEYIEGEYKGKPTQRVRVRMKVVEGPYAGNPADPENSPPGMVWGTHSASLAKKKDGSPSRLRELVQACFPTDLTEDQLYDLDLDTLVGKRLTVIGRYSESDAEMRYLEPIAYGRIAPNGAAAAAPAAPPVPGADEYQYQEQAGVRFRWKPGMATWEPVPAPPAAAAPPPLPAAPALPTTPPLPAAAPAPPPPAAAPAPAGVPDF